MLQILLCGSGGRMGHAFLAAAEAAGHTVVAGVDITPAAAPFPVFADAREYAGEIGEEAFKAILLHYTNVEETQIRHLEGKQYELADFVILNPDGSYRVAIDVKNMKDNYESKDSLISNRKYKREKLGCELLIINMLDLEVESTDIREICGLIDKEGRINPIALEKLRKWLATYIIP